jgi:hypothetical protein
MALRSARQHAADVRRQAAGSTFRGAGGRLGTGQLLAAARLGQVRQDTSPLDPTSPTPSGPGTCAVAVATAVAEEEASACCIFLWRRYKTKGIDTEFESLQSKDP